MTLVECFDRSVTENIVSILYLRPEKVIFLGQAEWMDQQLKRFRAFLAARGMSTKVEPRYVNLGKIHSITYALTEIVKQEKKCVIDVTGGDERVLMAVGAMLAGLDEQQRKKVAVQKFDLKTGAICDCDGDGSLVPGQPVELGVAELIALHGGVVYPATYQPEPFWRVRDLEPLWSIASADPAKWNRILSILGEFESWADSRDQVFLMLQYIRGNIAGFTEKKRQLVEFLSLLQKNRIITDYSRENVLEYTYTTPLNRYCMRKAGNVLEVKALLEARDTELDGRPFFHECMMGVQIDWDGVINDPDDHIAETRNEIDLILMHDATPLFVSCKNGDIDEAELYKLHTVAMRFGGHTAKKMLIATNLEKKSPSSVNAFVQRAADMDISLITNATELSGEEWYTAFQKAIY